MTALGNADWDVVGPLQEETTKRLAERGIKLYTAACGCCSSPWIKITIDDVVVYDTEGWNFGNAD